MVEHVKRLKRELVYKGAILDIYKDTMELPDGNKAEWDFVSHRMGAAAILPVMKDGRIVMVRQYRNALERETLEIPAGCRDSKTEGYGVLCGTGDGRGNGIPQHECETFIIPAYDGGIL